MPQKRTYSANLDIVADKMIDEKCHIMILGDSINNPTSANAMRIGYVDPTKWRPKYWRGISVTMSTSNAEGGFRIQNFNNTYTTPTTAVLEKDDPALPLYIHNRHTEFNLVGNSQCDILHESTVTDNNFRVSQIAQPTIVSGAVQIYGTEQTANSTFYNTDGFTIKSLFYADSTIPFSEGYRTLDNSTQNTVVSTLSEGYNTLSYTQSPATSNTTSGAACAEYRFSTGALANSNVGFLCSYIYNPNINGLSISHLGAGGWQIENHSSSTGVDLPPAESGRLGWYSNEALRKHMEFYEADVCMIWLGANSANEDQNSTDYIEEFDNLIGRIRSAARDVNRDIKIVAIAQYELSDDRILNIRNFLRTKAGYDNYLDVAFVDLYQAVKDDSVNGGDYGSWPVGYLADDVHPDDDGAKYFAGKIWDIVEDASTYDFSSPWDFQVAQAKHGSWEDLSEDISYDTNDVVQELSGLASKVVDEDSEYTAFISGMSAFKKGKK